MHACICTHRLLLLLLLRLLLGLFSRSFIDEVVHSDKEDGRAAGLHSTRMTTRRRSRDAE